MSKTIFITGTSTGFGRLMAITLANAGHRVIAGMRGVTSKNKAVAAVLSDMPNIEVLEIDILVDNSVQTAFKEVFSKYGRLDVLVNNAAVSGFGLLEAYSIDRIREMFEVNFYDVIRTYQAVLPEMRRNSASKM
jgi:NAD(P)-dependent dehydrogenase (short-subunit alcohol dehydrogenase family)